MRTNRLHTVVLSAAALTAAAGANPEFIALGDLPGGTFRSEALGLSPDGAAVLGRSVVDVIEELQIPISHPFRWTEAGGLIDLGSIDPDPIPGGGLARAASNAGDVVIGITATSGNNQAYTWTEAGGIVSMGGFDTPTGFSNAYDVTPDGSVVVGVAVAPGFGTTAFRWTPDGGFEDLPGFTARAISADGAFVAAYTVNPRIAFLWIEGVAVTTPLGLLSGGSFSEPWDMTPDGAVVVGAADALPSFDDPNAAAGDNLVTQGFIWRAETGMIALPLLPGAVSAQAIGVSADAGVVIGNTEIPNGPAAFIWTPEAGTRELTAALAEDHAFEPPGGWSLTNVAGVSDDGLVLVGSGTNPAGDVEGFLIRLPACDGDLDADGVVGSTDLNRVLAEFGAGDGGDADGDGDTDSDDLNIVLRAFGCEPAAS